ncbi:hypothetical protein J6590_013062 [Homalodisca vitripennis]|nr:hypothetical protein J6590_013062 [Homalodisca vitripennis]
MDEALVELIQMHLVFRVVPVASMHSLSIVVYTSVKQRSRSDLINIIIVLVRMRLAELPNSHPELVGARAGCYAPPDTAADPVTSASPYHQSTFTCKRAYFLGATCPAAAVAQPSSNEPGREQPRRLITIGGGDSHGDIATAMILTQITHLTQRNKNNCSTRALCSALEALTHLNLHLPPTRITDLSSRCPSVLTTETTAQGQCCLK